MAVKIVSKKVRSAEALAEVVIVEPEVVDNYATLSAKLAKREESIAPLKKQVDALQAEILGDTDKVVASNVKVTLQGITHEMQLGMKGNKTELVDAERAFELLGFELFLKLAKVSITALKEYMTPEQVAEVTKVERKNKRRIKVVKL